jgi:hypothetical protein
MVKYKSRNDFVSDLFSNKVACEIGVFKGEFSKRIFKANPLELHLIDPFSGSIYSGDKDGLNMQFATLEQEYINLVNYFSENANVFVHKGTSLNILTDFKDSYFDCIYIDGDHSYSGVKTDLNLAYSKVKNYGYIAGHDYCSIKYPDIVLAVQDFCKEKNLNIESVTEDKCPSFIIRNNK